MEPDKDVSYGRESASSFINKLIIAQHINCLRVIPQFKKNNGKRTSSVATGAWGARASPNPSPAGSCDYLPKSEEKKMEVGWGYRIILTKQITLKYIF